MKKRLDKKSTCACVFSIIRVAFLVTAAMNNSEIYAAQTESSQGQLYDFNIPAGNLDNALIMLGKQSDLQIIAPSSLTQNIKSAAVTGRISVEAAMAQLLKNTPLDYRTVNGNSILIYPAPAKTSDSSVSLGAVNIEGSSATASGGGNGSLDRVATEGSGSYATNYVSIGSKAPQKYNALTQSVSVLTQQKIQEQGIKNVDQALQNTTGITTLTDSTTGEQVYFSRGFAVTNVTIDGGAGVNSGNDTTILANSDMSMYDSIQLLRGADSFGSAGDSANPSGTINLVRKKPLDHNQLTFEVNAGSWDNYRGSLDVTGPLTDSGAVRGRAVLTGNRANTFYQNGYNNGALAYGILEADLSPDSVLTAGASYSYTDKSMWTLGLPRYADGRDLKLPRSYSLLAPDSNNRFNTREVFAKFNQKLGDNWDFNTQITHRYSTTTGINDPVQFWLIDDEGIASYSTSIAAKSLQQNIRNLLVDSSLNGKFDVFGLEQNIEFGLNYNKFKGVNDNLQTGGLNVGTNIFDYDINTQRAGDFAPDPDGTATYSTFFSNNDVTTLSGYARVDLSPIKNLHFITGPRWTSLDYSYNQAIRSYYAGEIFPSSSVENYKDIYWQIPMYALRYDFTPSWSVYASYTDVYEPQTGMVTFTGAALDPKTGTNQEAGIKYTSDNEAINASLAFYQSKINDIATRDGSIFSANTNCCYSTEGNYVMKSKGVDFEFQGQLTPWWQMSLGYTFNINKQSGYLTYGTDGSASTGPAQTQSPKHLLKLWNVFQLHGNPYLDKTKTGVGVIAQSSTYVSGYAYDLNRNASEYVFNSPGYAVVSAFASYQINENLNIALNVNNLFDKTYYSTVSDVSGGNWYGTPRNFLLTLTGKF